MYLFPFLICDLWRTVESTISYEIEMSSFNTKVKSSSKR